MIIHEYFPKKGEPYRPALFCSTCSPGLFDIPDTHFVATSISISALIVCRVDVLMIITITVADDFHETITEDGSYGNKWWQIYLFHFLRFN